MSFSIKLTGLEYKHFFFSAWNDIDFDFDFYSFFSISILLWNGFSLCTEMIKEPFDGSFKNSEQFINSIKLLNTFIKNPHQEELLVEFLKSRILNYGEYEHCKTVKEVIDNIR